VRIASKGKVCSIATTGLAFLVCLVSSSGRAQAPSHGPVLGEGAATIDSPVPGRSVTPGQDSFLYPSPVVPGVGGSIVPKRFGSLAPSAPLKPLRRTPSADRATHEMAYPESNGAPSFRLSGGWTLQPWVNRQRRGFSYAIALSPDATPYHWIWWSSLNEYYYLFDSAAARYLGVYDRVSRVYRPLDAVSRRWGKAIASPVPVPSEAPATMGSPSGAQLIQQSGLPRHG
jgi:hypothetical protein